MTKKTTKKISLPRLLVLTTVAMAIEYVLAVAFIATSQWLVNIAFNIDLDYNVWALALVAIMVSWAFKRS